MPKSVYEKPWAVPGGNSLLPVPGRNPAAYGAGNGGRFAGAYTWIFKLFPGYIPSELKFDLLHQPHIYGFLAILVLVVSLLSGFYPA